MSLGNGKSQRPTASMYASRRLPQTLLMLSDFALDCTLQPPALSPSLRLLKESAIPRRVKKAHVNSCQNSRPLFNPQTLNSDPKSYSTHEAQAKKIHQTGWGDSADGENLLGNFFRLKDSQFRV